jgi:hypothetical protein
MGEATLEMIAERLALLQEALHGTRSQTIEPSSRRREIRMGQFLHELASLAKEGEKIGAGSEAD